MEKRVNGNISGIRDSIIERIEQLYLQEQQGGEFLSNELMLMLSELTELIGREISVLISRSGRIEDVSIGDANTVSMPDIHMARSLDRLCGVRCVHTHPNGSGILSEVDIGTLNAKRFDAMTAVGVAQGKPTSVCTGFVEVTSEGEHVPLIYGPYRYFELPQKRLYEAIYEADNRLKSSAYEVAEVQPQRAVLVGIEGNEGYDSLGELEQLAYTAGVVVVHKELQRRRGIDTATYIGSGKAEELRLISRAVEADVVIFDDELSAVQMRNLEELFALPVIDRTMLILDIFAARANTSEGKLQVELAQLKYRLPRLLGMGLALSRQGASCVGMRGPGEKKLEVDRRRIRRRVFELEQELKTVEKQRALKRSARSKKGLPIVALVGYTNAGKSTLLNRLTESSVLAEDKLFATLDPVIRKLTLKSGAECLLSDTVGFINKLPHDLVSAFRSTLEEVREADLILHVIDISCPHYDVQMRVVEQVLTSLNAIDTPRINVYNKTDLVDELPNFKNGNIGISAASGVGLEELLELVEAKLNEASVRVTLTIPYEKYGSAAAIRGLGTLLKESHSDEGAVLELLIDRNKLWQVEQFTK
ncbi:MAG: GTPase HflX [Clostridia bacterium]|nr:GTPase HflX [Clostridia bacterium]